MVKLNSKMSNQALFISLMTVSVTAWWILIYKEGLMYHFIWALFIIALIPAWAICIRLFYESYRSQRQLNTIMLSFLFDLLILHTVIGICGIFVSSDEGTWHIGDLTEFVPFWMYLMGITYCVMMGIIHIKEKKIIKGIVFISLGVIVVIVGWILLIVWARHEIGIGQA